MGMFDFVAEFGKKLFGKDDDPAEKIQQEIEQSNPGVSGLGVSYEEGTVILSGQAESADALEKAVLMAGNVRGVHTVQADAVAAPQQSVAVEFYTIVRGDTLSGIAKRFYGNAMDYPLIFEANREVIKDPDSDLPGAEDPHPGQGMSMDIPHNTGRRV